MGNQSEHSACTSSISAGQRKRSCKLDRLQTLLHVFGVVAYLTKFPQYFFLFKFASSLALERKLRGIFVALRSSRRLGEVMITYHQSNPAINHRISWLYNRARLKERVNFQFCMNPP